MKYEYLVGLIDNIASDFLFLDDSGIDILSAGKFLNSFDSLSVEAEKYEIQVLKKIVHGLSAVLENIVLGNVDQKEGYRTFEKGIVIMQEIGDSYKNTGDYKGDIENLIESICELTGIKIHQDNQEQFQENKNNEKKEKEEQFRIEDEELLKDFITEGLEYINEIEINVLNLEQEPEEKEHVNSIFRPFHSIKGVASFLDLEDIRDLAHELENLLDQVRSDYLSVSPQLIDIILDGSDSLKSMISSLKDVLNGNADEPVKLDWAVLRSQIQGIYQKEDFDSNVQGETKKIGTILVEDGILTPEALEESLKISETHSSKKIGETLITEGKVTAKQVSQALRKQAVHVADNSTIRVDVKKLDDLVDMIGELVITQSMLKEHPAITTSADRKLVGAMSQLSSITSELQRESTTLRMIPIKQTFQRMSRVVRDVAKSSRKSVIVELVGEDTEIDRNMVEEIYNPLVHMMRNSVDHGIETPEERIKCGKPERGKVELKAYHRGSNVVIEIADDGQGLNKDKIVKKAIEKGIIKNSDGLSDHDIFRLIFSPGFSTAEQITDVSGRGVGMDVVKQAVERLRGKIEIESTEGEGTSFITLFPLTMAIIDGMIVKVGKEKYIIPATAIRQLLRPGRDFYNNVIGKGEMINVMGNMLPLLRLHEVLNIEPDNRNPWEALVVVIDVQNRSKCLLVDEVISKEEIVIKNLGDGLKRVKGISSGAILSDGNVGLILDPEGLFELGEN